MHPCKLFNGIRKNSGGAGLSEKSGCDSHRRQPFPIPQKSSDGLPENRPRIAVGKKNAGSRVGNGPRIFRLVIRGGMRIRDENRGNTGSRQLGDR